MSKQWKVTKWDAERRMLTTSREGGRFEDFWIDPEDDRCPDKWMVEASKHYGDHDYTSGGTVEIDKSDCGHEYEALLKAAIEFNNG